jgi:hypothetical protein
MATEALLKSAQYCLDLYYQEYAPEDAFFTVEDFAYWLGVVYDKDVDDIAKQQYSNSYSETGTGQITFSGDFLKTKTYKLVHKDGQVYVELDFKFATFTYDSQESGIQEVLSLTNGGGECIRTTLTDLWKLKHTGISNIVWWYPIDKRLEFRNNNDCYPKSVIVFYVPTSEDEQFSLPKSREFDIATRAWALMTQAKEGVVVETANNGNNIATVESEIDKTQLKVLP